MKASELISLKSLKIMQSLSEETLCFSATLYIGKTKLAAVSNRGQGGPNEYHFFGGRSEGQKLLDETAKKWAEANGEKGIELDDLMVGTCIDEMDDMKQAKKAKKKGFPITIKILKDKRVYDFGPDDKRVSYGSALFVSVREESQIDGVLKKEKAEKWEILRP